MQRTLSLLLYKLPNILFFLFYFGLTHLCPFSKSKFNLYKALSLTVSTMLLWLVLSIELGTVQTGTGKVDPARKFKCTTAARGLCRLHAALIPFTENLQLKIMYFQIRISLLTLNNELTPLKGRLWPRFSPAAEPNILLPMNSVNKFSRAVPSLQI